MDCHKKWIVIKNQGLTTAPSTAAAFAVIAAAAAAVSWGWVA
jgi:hypothetical protein